MTRGPPRTFAKATVIDHSRSSNLPPASTAAAQIVDNISTDAREVPQSGEREYFEQLLLEILSTDNAPRPNGSVAEQDLETNYNLIKIVTNAGLLCLHRDDPFLSVKRLLPQACNSLAVLLITLERTPEVLLQSGFSSSMSDEAAQTPLLFWLVPKLIALIGKPEDEDFQKRLLDLLLFIPGTLAKTSLGKQTGLVLSRYLKIIVTDTTSLLAGSGPAFKEGKSQNPSIPRLEILSELPRTKFVSSWDARYQISISSNPQALRISTILLSMIQRPQHGSNHTNFNEYLFHENTIWVLDVASRLWVHSRNIEAHFEGPATKVSPYSVQLLEYIGKLTQEAYGTANALPIVQKACWLLGRWISELLNTITDESLKVTLSSYVLGIRQDVAETSICAGSYRACLLPTLYRVVGQTQSKSSKTNGDNLPNGRSEWTERLHSECILLIKALENRKPPVKQEDQNNITEDEPGKKRRKISDPLSVCEVLARKVSVHILDQDTSNLRGLNTASLELFSSHSEELQCEIIDSIGRLACIGATTSKEGFAEKQKENVSTSESNLCSTCDQQGVDNSTGKRWEGSNLDGLVLIMVKITKLTHLANLPRIRLHVALAAKRILNHTNDLGVLDLQNSQLGQWCMQLISSSVRELRIMTGRIIPSCFTNDLGEEVLQSNMVFVTNFLKMISENKPIGFQETAVMALGQLGRICYDHNLGPVLKKLVEYLGHTNALIHGAAFGELSALASQRDMTPDALLSPYWREIAITVVRDIHHRPQTVQLLSDLIGMDVSEFLVATQRYTLPWLIYYRKHDVLVRIAQACGNGETVWSICYDKVHLPAILAFLLVQTTQEQEGLIVPLLTAAAPDFGDAEGLNDLLIQDSILVAFELLMIAADIDEQDISKIHQAISRLAHAYSQRQGSSAPKSKKRSTIAHFFDCHVLGIMASIADVIHDSRGIQPMVEKLRCIRATKEMIRIAKNHISIGLPQICACLQLALESDHLRDAAFSAWYAMIMVLDEDDLEALLGSTFSIVVRHWNILGKGSQTQAYNLLYHLFSNHGPGIGCFADSLPSLSSIPELSEFETNLLDYKAKLDVRQQFSAFASRCQHENATVVGQALQELAEYLQLNQTYLHDAAISEQSDSVLATLVRAVLDACTRLSTTRPDISKLGGQCLGLIGCIDPNRVEAIRENRNILVLSNLERADETIEFLMLFVEQYLVKCFLSATSTRSQGFYAFVMQETLKFCGLSRASTYRTRDTQPDMNYRRWIALPEAVRNTLAPFLDSRYTITIVPRVQPSLPIYNPRISHATWLRIFTLDLMENGVGENAELLFPVISRAVQPQETTVANFLLPFVVLNVVVGGKEGQQEKIISEMLEVLKQQPQSESAAEIKNLRLCSETLFQVLDYLSRWMQEKRKSEARYDSESPPSIGVERVQSILSSIPANLIAQRAIECKSYARALFYWEQHIRTTRSTLRNTNTEGKPERLYERLQHIYTQIDEPDGIEGISAHLQILNIDQQILQHRTAGRWTAAQSWYELQLAEQPDNTEIQVNLLSCLKESGQYDTLLNQVDGLHISNDQAYQTLPFAIEATWVTGKWEKLKKYLGNSTDSPNADFNVALGQAFLALYSEDYKKFKEILEQLRATTAGSLSMSNTASLQACHETMLKLHVLTEVEMISGTIAEGAQDRNAILRLLDRRLEVVGAFLSDKQYLLGIRRATMQLSKLSFSNDDVASVWLTSAKLARKAGSIHQSFNAVLHASQLGAKSSTIEHSKILWLEGHHRNAIQSLEGAIAANAFRSYDAEPLGDSVTAESGNFRDRQNLLTARAHLLLAKWMDNSGQTHSHSIIEKYQKAANAYVRWEKGHYYLGKHYNKLLESERAQPPQKQSQSFISGETAKLVVQNYLRSLGYGTKFLFQTLPKLLTLWLELGSDVDKTPDPRCGTGEVFKSTVTANRKQVLQNVHVQLKKYIEKLPAFVFYTALPQIVARICHPNKEVHTFLQHMIVKVVGTHPQQAMWTLLAVAKSSNKARASRGTACVAKVREFNAKRSRTDANGVDLKALALHGHKLSEALLDVCDTDTAGMGPNISISKDLGFNHRLAPCNLVVPLERTLTASLPAVVDKMAAHKAFSSDTTTISCFLDDVLVLSSLQRPRKLSVRGSDGRVYGLLCKPKDDLRKDQRLMEFNAMINRSLKRDAESSKRQLYIKTYAVTPLNEECGIIEWVDNLKTLRDILLKLYKTKGVFPNYNEIRGALDDICNNPAKMSTFDTKVLAKFPPTFHEWFVEMFPEPSAWFTARLRYTRSCAVMSMVGMVLGLGDRHGENILFEEGNGGTFHVDFNCLFDKGLTFEKPELVPFRLTQNMVDAFGVYGIEGPFRKSCELTLSILRANEDTLMTILETFLYDPTTDFIGKKKRQRPDVPDTPQEVLDSVRSKVRGMLKGEAVPLSVEGHVHELIQQATSPKNLAAMYIGWCAFF